MALDNADARSFVNSMCITLNIPMLEAGLKYIMEMN